MEMEYHGHCLCGGCSIVIKTLTQLKQFTCNCECYDSRWTYIADLRYPPSTTHTPRPIPFSTSGADCQHTSGSLHSTNIFPLAQDVSLVGDVHEYNSRASSGNVGVLLVAITVCPL
jgi:hypothetical protein